MNLLEEIGKYEEEAVKRIGLTPTKIRKLQATKRDVTYLKFEWSDDKVCYEAEYVIERMNDESNETQKDGSAGANA